MGMGLPLRSKSISTKWVALPKTFWRFSKYLVRPSPVRLLAGDNTSITVTTFWVKTSRISKYLSLTSQGMGTVTRSGVMTVATVFLFERLD